MDDDGFDFGADTGFAGESAGPPEPAAVARDPAAAKDEEEDISAEELAFGSILGKAEFLSNAEAVALFEGLQQDESSMLPAQKLAAQFAKRFKGAPAKADYDTLNELRQYLSGLEYAREATDGGVAQTVTLHSFEISALSNLAPGSVDEAIALIPSLSRFTPEEVEQMLAVLALAVGKAGSD